MFNFSIVKFEDLTIERYLTGDQADTDFLEWFQQSFSVEGTSSGPPIRKHGSVVLSWAGKDVARWTFEGAWIRSSKFSDLAAGTSTLMTQTIVLSVERIVRTMP